MSRQGQHVVPNTKGGWSVRKTGAARATKVFGTMSEAIDYARELARKQAGELYVHSKDGTIKDRATYTRDPLPPRGGTKDLYR